MDFGALPERLAHVRAEIARRQAPAGRTDPVTIVAVTKGFGLEAVEAALAAGLADVGENRVQEALEKLDTPVGRQAKWHLVGHLQRNKAKHVAGRFALIHSVDSAELAEELDKRAGGGRGTAPSSAWCRWARAPPRRPASISSAAGPTWAGCSAGTSSS